MTTAFFVFGLADNGFIAAVAMTRIFLRHLSLVFSIFQGCGGLFVLMGAYILPRLQRVTHTLWIPFLGQLVMVAMSTAAALAFFTLDSWRQRQNDREQTATQRLCFDALLQNLSNVVTPFLHRRSWNLSLLFDDISKMPRQVWLLYLHAFTFFSIITVASIFAPVYLHEWFSVPNQLAPSIIPGLMNLITVPFAPIFGLFFDTHGHRATILNIVSVTMVATFGMCLWFSLQTKERAQHHASWWPWCFATLLGIVLAAVKSVGSPTLGLLIPSHLVPEANLLLGCSTQIGAFLNASFAAIIMSKWGFIGMFTYTTMLCCVTLIVTVSLTIIDWRVTAGRLQLRSNRTQLSEALPSFAFLDLGDEKV